MTNIISISYSITNFSLAVADGNKEQLRFNKSKMLIGHPEEVSLRPSASSMMFKQSNIKPNLPLNNGTFSLLLDLLFYFYSGCLSK